MVKKVYFNCIFAGILLVCGGCLPVFAGGHQGISSQVRNEIGSHALDLAAWEINNLLSDSGKDTTGDPALTDFSGLQENISRVLTAENITVFPGVRVKLVEPPLLLVVSNRDRIVYLDRMLLMPGLSEDVMAQIEKKVDALGLSSLVVRIGGFGAAYPAIVSPGMKSANIVNAAVEEWAHQYLAFKPLGFLYLADSLGLRQDPDIIVMNETLAGMIAQEIGGKVYQEYYMSAEGQPGVPGRGVFDFDKEMRETRLEVDGLLVAGKIDEAEGYMEARRIYFNSHGYRIRKLNQAYFAFHGIYGQDPGAVSPVYRDMLKLRKSCASMSGFVDRVSAMTALAELEQSVSASP